MDNRDDFDRFDSTFDYKYPTSRMPQSKKPSQKGYEGVEYVPSGKIPQGQNRENRPQGSRRSGSGGKATYGSYSAKKGYGQPSGKRKMKSQSQSRIYMAIIVAVGVSFCLLAFYMAYRWISSNTGSKVKTGQQGIQQAATDEPKSITEDEQPLVSDADAEISGLITKIATQSGTVTLVNAEDDSLFDIYVNAQTSYRNKYGQAMTLSQFQEGDIVIAEYNSVNKKAAVFRMNPEAWTKASVKNIEINPATTTVKLMNDTFLISKNALFLPEGTEPSVKPSDTVSLKGLKSTILAVVIEKRTGTLEFKNKEKIVDGTVEVDSDIYKALEETGSLKVSTGTHTVVVKGANIEVFITEVTILEGETVVIDLAEAQMKEGLINLVVNEAEYTLYVNDEIVSSSQQPLTLPFGAYKLKVTKDGFTPWEGSITVNAPTVTVTASLTEEVKTGKITVTTSPEYVNGSVYIDNALIGTAPVYRATVTYGTHQLTVRAPGYVETSVPIIVEGDNSYNVIMIPLSDTGNTGTQSGNTQIPDTGTTNTGNTGVEGDGNLDFPAAGPDIPDYMEW